MTKLSRLQLLLLVLTIALVGLAVYFVVVVVQQASAASDLESQVAEVDSQIAKVSNQYDVDALQAQLDSLQAELDEGEFPTKEEVENVQILDLVINAEHEAGIQVDSFWPEKPTAVSLNDNGRTYTAYIHAVTALSADVPGIYHFLHAIESSAPFETLVINNVALEFVAATNEEPAHWDMECDIIVYARK